MYRAATVDHPYNRRSGTLSAPLTDARYGTPAASRIRRACRGRAAETISRMLAKEFSAETRLGTTRYVDSLLSLSEAGQGGPTFLAREVQTLP